MRMAVWLWCLFARQAAVSPDNFLHFFASNCICLQSNNLLKTLQFPGGGELHIPRFTGDDNKTTNLRGKAALLVALKIAC